MQEETFSIRSEINQINFYVDKVYGFPESTFFMGGYDSECRIEVLSHNFSVKDWVYISTAQFHVLYEQLKKAFKSLNGKARIGAYENDFYAELTFDGLGHVTVEGCYSKYGNELKFCFETDQTFIEETLNELSKIVDKYGDNLGKTKQITT